MALKQVFSFGGWMAHHMCFKCRATQPGGAAPYTDVSSSALWKQLRYTSAEFIKYLLDQGLELSPILSLPGFVLSFIVIGVLHAVDLGVAADVVGSFFFGLINGRHGFFSGTYKERRVINL